MIGHDFYGGRADGQKDPAFTDPASAAAHFAAYVRMATEKSAGTVRTDHFDCLHAHNPTASLHEGHRLEALVRVRDEKLTEMLACAGTGQWLHARSPACFERLPR